MVLDQIAGRLHQPTPYRSPWGTLFSLRDHAPDAGYFLSDDKSLLFVLVETPGHDGGFMATAGPSRSSARLIRSPPSQRAGQVTGGPTLSGDEMTAAFTTAAWRPCWPSR
jgi:hypothetical protein